MFDTAKFGAFVAKLRKSADMTQSELGDRLGLTRQAISRYECGDSFPDISVLREIAAIFGIPLEPLINSGDPTEGEAEIIDAVAAGRDITPKNPSDVVNLAPLLKPSVLTKLSDSMEKQGIDMSQVLSLAEYLNETDTQKLMKSVSFDSLADMDMNLLERLLPLLGPYASETVFQKIIDGELDYHYLELLGDYPDSQIEAAVVYGVLDSDAINIMRRNNYNRARMKKRGIIRLFTCPDCGNPLSHLYPRRCKCGNQPITTDNILHMTETSVKAELSPETPDLEFIRQRFGSELLILMLGAVNMDSALELYFGTGVEEHEIVVLDSDLGRLQAAEKATHAKNNCQLMFVLDNIAAPHLTPDNFDLIIDNTAAAIGETDALRSVLKNGGCVIRGSQIRYEK